jgi:actin-related protein
VTCREKGYTTQRKFAPWIGGSLMSSFETYHKTLKITRQEWEEHPDMILRSKCF